MGWRWLEKTEKNNSTIALDVLYAKKVNIYIYIYIYINFKTHKIMKTKYYFNYGER